MTQTDHGSAGTHVEVLESGKHRGDFSAAPAGGIARVIGSGGHRQYRGMLIQLMLLDHVVRLWLRLIMKMGTTASPRRQDARIRIDDSTANRLRPGARRSDVFACDERCVSTFARARRLRRAL